MSRLEEVVPVSTQLPTGMEHHPDILALREHAERATSTTLGQGVEALGVCCGLFLAISPWVVGYAGLLGVFGSGVVVSNLILGLGYAWLMSGYGAFERTHARAYASLAIGVWTILAPWFTVGDEAIRRVIWTNLVVGGLMTCAALAAIGLAMSGTGGMMRRRGGG
ncbi:SPW repeat domain-containing protein [Kitasatospora camelliae]|uniref:SPW repeat protein n=1 Tax=Kitasatospora camelliae TaxID=3156397 RepID=A0AAU8K2A5_9ACTN